ncbi:MAG: nucleotidyltransferase family protein [bacterium]|nr:nucleotidyltransferase family protein [bacterium]
MRIAGLCLAAGAAQRMGQPKQLLPWGKTTLLQTCVHNLLRTQMCDCTVVVGANAQDVTASLEEFAQEERFSITVNERWAEGMSTSLAAGVRSLLKREAADNPYIGVLIALGDMPFVEPRFITLLLEEQQRWGSTAIVAPVYAGKRGHPVLIGRAYWQELLQLSGDRGAAEVLRRHQGQLHLVPGTAGVLMDIDTVEQWRERRPSF